VDSVPHALHTYRDLDFGIPIKGVKNYKNLLIIKKRLRNLARNGTTEGRNLKKPSYSVIS
jgi:hypothetical protein